MFGGLEEIRTPDPHNANVVRSQLRYEPMNLTRIIVALQVFVKYFLFAVFDRGHTGLPLENSIEIRRVGEIQNFRNLRSEVANGERKPPIQDSN